MESKKIPGRRMARIVGIFVLFSVATTCGMTFAGEQSQNTVSGRVVDMDSMKSMITVSYTEPFSGKMNEVNILVPEGARIMNGSETIIFLDLEQFDAVTVTYEDDGANGLRAREILVLNPVNQ